LKSIRHPHIIVLHVALALMVGFWLAAPGLAQKPGTRTPDARTPGQRSSAEHDPAPDHPAGSGTGKTLVIDEAGLLNASEKEALMKELAAVSRDLDADYVVVTKKQLDGVPIERFAKEFFRKNGYGRRGGNGGILVVAMSERDFWFSAFGQVVDLYEKRVDRIVSQVGRHLKAGHHQKAFLQFADAMRPPGFFDKVSIIARTGPPLVIALVLTALIVGGLALGHRGSITVTHSTYAKPGAFKLISAEDEYLRTTTTKTKIEKSSGSSRSSGSSSGRSCGGGGKF
jgi:uncharacterized protein